MTNYSPISLDAEVSKRPNRASLIRDAVLGAARQWEEELSPEFTDIAYKTGRYAVAHYETPEEAARLTHQSIAVYLGALTCQYDAEVEPAEEMALAQ